MAHDISDRLDFGSIRVIRREIVPVIETQQSKSSVYVKAARVSWGLTRMLAAVVEDKIARKVGRPPRPAPEIEPTPQQREDHALRQRIQALVGLDFEAELGDCTHHLAHSRAYLIVESDLSIDGDMTTRELAHGLCRARALGLDDAMMNRLSIVVCGDVEIRGHLEIEQYYELMVTGDLAARSVRGSSSSLVVRGELEARELVVQEKSEEGGLMYTSCMRTPLYLLLGEGIRYEELCDVSGDTFWAMHDEVEPVICAVRELTGNSDEDMHMYLWGEIEELILSGRGPDLVTRLEQELA